MIRAVLDTNILLRMAASGNRSQINQQWRNHHFDLLMSLATFTEFRIVVARPKIQNYVSSAVSQAFLALLEARAVIVQSDLTAPTCRDQNDTALIATAVGGQADFLVTADPDLLDDPILINALAQLHIRVAQSTEFVAHLKHKEHE
jgi:putative PIN family toxin of toxin-antitoxin system